MAILAAMLTYCNGESGQARPGIKALMDDTGYSEKTLERALRALRGANMILPIAYANGGRGRSTVYGFALPAWSGQGQEKTTDKLTGVSVQPETINHRHSVPKPPTFCPKTTDILTVPTERTERTEGAGAAGRGEVDKVPDPERGGEMVTFTQLLRDRSYSEARNIWERWTAANAAEC